MAMIRRLVLFIALPIVSALSPILVLPVLTATLGAGTWSAIAVGQSVGAFGLMVLTFSWNIVGPTSAASTAPEARRRLYADSIASRLASGAVALPLASTVAYLLSPTDRVAGALMALAVTLGGALPTWFFVGTGEPLKIFAFDVAPRLVAAAAAVALLPVLPRSWLFPSLLIATTLVAAVWSAVQISGKDLRVPHRRELRHFREHALLVSSGLISSGYTSSAVSLVALVSPGSVASFAAAQRIQGFVLTAIAAITNAQQGWVSAFDADARVRRSRRRTAFLVNGVVGLLAGVAVVALLGPASDLLFSGTVAVSGTAAVLVGATVLVLALNLSATFHIHIPSGRRHQLAIIGIATTVVGVPLLLVLASSGGVEGGLLAILVAETFSLGAQLVLLLVVGRDREPGGNSSPIGRQEAFRRVPEPPSASPTGRGSLLSKRPR